MATKIFEMQFYGLDPKVPAEWYNTMQSVVKFLQAAQANQAAGITIADAGGYYTSGNVEGALQEVGLRLNNVSTASGISIIDSGNYYTSGNVEGALAEIGATALSRHCGAMTISGNTTTISFTAAVDPTLHTNTDYKQVSGIFDNPPQNHPLHGITYASSALTVNRTGDYHIATWTSITSNTNNTNVAIKYAVNGTISLGRRPWARVGTAGDRITLTAFGVVHLNAGDVITLYAASDKTANITFEDMVTELTELRTG